MLKWRVLAYRKKYLVRLGWMNGFKLPRVATSSPFKSIQ